MSPAHFSWSLLATIVRLLVLDWGNIADRFQEATILEPPHPFQGGANLGGEALDARPNQEDDVVSSPSALDAPG